MFHFGTFRSFISLPAIAMGTLLVAASHSSAAGNASAQGPLLVAQASPTKKIPKYDLQYKLSRGEVLRYDVTHQASISGTSEKTTQTAQSKTTSLKSWKVTDVLPNGDIEFMNVCERVHMVNQLPDRKATEYDSTRDKTPPPGFEDASKAVGVPLSTIRITPRGKIVSRDIKIHNQVSSDDSQIVLRLPDSPVEIGDTWDEPFEVKVSLPKGLSKSIKTRWHHKLLDVKDGIATIEVTYQVLSPTDAGVELELVQRMMTGQVIFNITKGRIQSQKMDVDKRIIGFAGPTSSMQYIMKMEESLKEEPTTASKANSRAKGKAPITRSQKSTQVPAIATRPDPAKSSKAIRR